MQGKISTEEIREYLDIETFEFPKYVAPLINLANQYAQGTRPGVVGQMSDFIQQFTGKTLPEWESWYLKQKPEAIKNATEKILQMLKKLNNAHRIPETENLRHVRSDGEPILYSDGTTGFSKGN